MAVLQQTDGNPETQATVKDSDLKLRGPPANKSISQGRVLEGRVLEDVFRHKKQRSSPQQGLLHKVSQYV
ncbi:hypothetical protein EYF80_051666 [Liparis tanakae]|uniref:Uncharacterized protein n=1 Tax=Liparis tanakae TaxID=230148 RepID=A0A4Z2FBM7_9TELE|nr:hypothetical protein EYF80_051666 [Liparis tanakae]